MSIVVLTVKRSQQRLGNPPAEQKALPVLCHSEPQRDGHVFGGLDQLFCST